MPGASDAAHKSLKREEEGKLPCSRYLLAQDAYLLRCQVVQGEDEPPVEAAFPSQGAIVDICLLHVLL